MNINGFDITPQSGGAGVNDISISTTAVNEGIDKEVVVDGVCGDKSASLRLIHEGLRQPIALSGGGVFRVAGGGRFGVLKEGAAPEPAETYTPLSYIEATGTQYIDLGYVVKETDVIKMSYENRSTTSADKFFFGTSSGSAGLWVSQYSSSAYIRFGHSSSKTVSTIRTGRNLTLKKGSLTVGTSSTTLSYTSMPEATLYLFAGHRAGSGAYAFGYVRCMLFEIIDANGDSVMSLSPMKRGSDGKVGLLDSVSGRFFINQGTGNDFVAGPEING